MNKFVVNTLMVLVLSLFSLVSQATLITNLTQAELAAKDYANAEDQLTADLQGINYITYQGYDWAWVSSLNLEFSGTNTLYDPKVQKNWQFADKALLTVLKTELSLADFTDSNGDFIQSVEFFNSEHTTLESNSIHDFNVNFISSNWTMPGTFLWDVFSQQETFYVRNSFSVQSAPIPSTIPEPLTSLIFVLSLFIMQRKLRKI